MIDAIYATGDVLFGIESQAINWLNPSNRRLLGRINQLDGYVGAVGRKTATTWLFVDLHSATRARYELINHRKVVNDQIYRYVVNESGVPEIVSEVHE